MAYGFKAPQALQAQDTLSAYGSTDDLLREALNRLDDLARQVGEVKQAQQQQGGPSLWKPYDM